MRRKHGAIAAALTAAALGAGGVAVASSVADNGNATTDPAALVQTSTPIKHVVVLFGENVSFDHYFGTYPNAANTDGVPFTPAPGTPSVNGLTPDLMRNNANESQPVRLTPDEAITCDQGHGYGAEQEAYDNGRVDRFVQDTSGGCDTPDGHDMVMGYYDGNTVTALWNYAQHYSLNDNSYGTTYGPSAVGAVNLISGQTGGATPTDLSGSTADGTIYGDPDPRYDQCGAGSVELSGRNVGDLLNTKSLTWGWFEGGFRSTSNVLAGATAACAQRDTNIGGVSQQSYVSHHEPFEFYPSTANPRHLPPSSESAVGQSDRANHQYDIEDFNAAVSNGTMPSVSYLKAPGYEDAHPSYSDPIDEQHFIVDEVNRIEESPDWGSTAIIIAYDDSDGWYDHVQPPQVRGSRTVRDFLNGAGVCGPTPAPGDDPVRCGFGPRLPLMVISPWAQQNHVDNTLTDQSSVLRFIEDNWGLGRIGGGSTDAQAGTLDGMFDFNPSDKRAPKVILGQDGTVQSIEASDATPAATVTVPAPVQTVTATVTTPAPPATTPTTPPAPPRRAATSTAERRLTATVKSGSGAVSVALRAPASERATGSVKLTARVRSGRRTRTVAVGSRAFTLAAGKSSTLKIALNASGRRALASTGRLSIALAISSKVDGATTTIRRTVTLKAAPRTRPTHASRVR